MKTQALLIVALAYLPAGLLVSTATGSEVGSPPLSGPVQTCRGPAVEVLAAVEPGELSSRTLSRSCVAPLSPTRVALALPACPGGTVLIGKGWDNSTAEIYQYCGSSGPCSARLGGQVNYSVSYLQAANDLIRRFSAYSNCNAVLYSNSNLQGAAYYASPNYNSIGSVVNPGISSIRWYGRS